MDLGDSLSLNLSGPLGQKKSPQSSPRSTPSALNLKRFDSNSSNKSGFLTPAAEKSSLSTGGNHLDSQGDVSKGWGGKMRRLTANNAGIFGNATSNATTRERDGGGRLSMWGEQLHDKLFAKKDMKDVMRNKLKLNLKDDNNDTPQNSHADINSIIDYDEEDKQQITKNNFVSDFIECTAFRTFILSTIVINSVFIALQTDKEMEQKFGYLFSALDQLILTIFICEVLLKWYGGFFTYWKVGWNIFDFIIVASSLIGPSLTFISNSRILRILRVLRAFRSLRSISALRPLQLVVQTIIQSLPDMANIILLLVIFMFVFAVIGVSLFAADSPHYFGSLETAMFTLFICITLDGWVEIFNTLRDNQFPLATIYFVIFILIGAFILINLVVAVVVTNLESAIAEQDELDLQQMHEEKGNQDDHGELSTYDLRDVIHKKFWKHQKPVEVPNLPALNPLKVQNYIILVTAFEDNYAELVFLKEELLKISKEVWEWNSVVEDEDVFTVPCADAYVPSVQTTKAKKLLEEQEKRKPPPDKGRTSILANLLTRASVIMTGDSAPDPPKRIKRKSTLSSSQNPGYVPLKPLVEMDDSDGEEDEETDLNLVTSHVISKGKERATKDTGLGYPTPNQAIPNVEVDSDDEESDEEEGIPVMANVYADLPRVTKQSTANLRKDSKTNRVQALRERRQSLIEELDRRDRKGDVLSDLITMNKKTNNFSGKSGNMTEFVRGVDWLRSKVKGPSDVPERKLKWQVEADKERKISGIYNPARQSSITSDTLLEHHLSYIAGSTNSQLDVDTEEEILKTASQMRRASIASIVRNIEEVAEGDKEEVANHVFKNSSQDNQ
ncbi:sodium channel protein type 4 subunit alpha-like isoform X2 [Bolinopsis microptera]|uniref:sodium channel protein type 4 subunit alpha-like isoform X2 n=1 Tax=Bolinopsis microptera TaxID=2820187 RepID=UPI003079F3E0